MCFSMRIGFVVTPLLLPLVSCQGDDADAHARRAYELAATEAKSLTLTAGSRPLVLKPEPLLRWSNPVSGEVYGDVYIWTLDGRPEVIASIFKWFSPHTHMSGEFQSLSESPLSMKRDGESIWTPSAGLEMKPLPGVAAPSNLAFQRLRQMRDIASQFKAEAVDRNDANSKWLLRPLAKPIYRYQSEGRGIVDGALFAYCQGNTNNPEVLLMLEARKTGDQLSWHYGLGRQNSLQFRVYRDGELIWDVPRLAPPWSDIQQPGKPYFLSRTDFDQ